MMTQSPIENLKSILREKIGEVQRRIKLFTAVTHDCLMRSDWHGIQRSGADIREQEAALEVLRFALVETEKANQEMIKEATRLSSKETAITLGDSDGTKEEE